MDNGGELYRQFLGGDKNALVQIIRLYKDGLTYFLSGFCGGRLNEAEELTEETFVRLYVKKPKYSARSSFKTWLYSVGRNVAVDAARKSRKYLTENYEQTAQPDLNTDPESVYFSNVRNILLYNAMGRLKDEYRQVLWLVYFENMKSAEAARVMKKKTNNIDVMLHRARAALKKELEKDGVDYENICTNGGRGF